jgi:hypothetical protein
MSVVAIYSEPPAVCPHNITCITCRFLQSRGATAWDLNQLGGAIDIRMDYPFLKPEHLEQKMRGSPLHLYTSMSRGGLILQGMEIPEEDMPA